MSEAVVIRNDDGGGIDEVLVRGSVHIERMSGDGWFMGVEAEDGSYWQFWFGSKNRRSHVEFRHTEHMTPEENKRLKQQPTTPSTNQGDAE
jgi:hypothetical protein